MADTKLTYGLNSDRTGYIVTGYENIADGGEVVIPDKHNNGTNGEKFVVGINTAAFSRCTSLRSIVIPDSVTSIGSGAFYGCTGLKSITIPDSVTSIYSQAFNGCSSLESITLPFVGGSKTATSSSLSIFGYIFGSSSYEGGIKTMQYYSPGSATYYYIPTSLKSVTVTGGNILYGAFCNCSGLRSITVGNSVESIGGQAFYGCTGLTSIVIPDSVTSIGEDAFYNCTGLESVTIGKSVASIGEAAFVNCTELMSIVIPDSVTSIGRWAFDRCTGLTSVTIGNGVESIDYCVFRGCTGLASIVIPDSVTSIGGAAFSGCAGLTQVTIPDSVTNIDGQAFYACTGLTGVYISDIVAWCRISFSGFYANPLYYANNLYLNGQLVTELVIQDSITSIYDHAFEGCTSFTSIEITNSVTSIGNYAFEGCIGLTSVTIDNSVMSIGERAFSGCIGLESITLPFVGATKDGTSKTHFGHIFGANNSVDNDSYVPASLKTVVITNATSIGSYAFSGCAVLEGITIPDSVESIGASAFYGCTSLKYNTYGNAKYLGSSTNQYLVLVEAASNSITSAIIHENTKIIVNNAFYNCAGLESITIPFVGASKNGTSNTHFGYIFGASSYSYNDSYVPASLKTVVITGGTSIGSYAFYNCKNLISITIPDSVESIGESAFSGCSSLKYNTYGNAKYLGSSTNQYLVLVEAANTSITSITIHENTKKISERAFDKCMELTSVYFIETIANIAPDAFATESTPQKTLTFYYYNGVYRNDNYPYGRTGPVERKYVGSYQDMDFLGFTFNGKHSYFDLGVLRTINDRIQHSLSPEMNDTTADNPGGDGTYYFGSRHKSRKLSIDFAFDHLTEQQMREWKRFCSSKELSDLIFDEEPYKVYTAKITGAPILKIIPFDKNGERIYKGEGTLEFTCYWPYAHTPDENTKVSKKIFADGKFGADGKSLDSYLDFLYFNKDQWAAVSGLQSLHDKGMNPGDIPAPFVYSLDEDVAKETEITIDNLKITIGQNTHNLKWDSKTGIVSGTNSDGDETTRKPLPHSGESLGGIPVGGTATFPQTGTLTYHYWYY